MRHSIGINASNSIITAMRNHIVPLENCSHARWSEDKHRNLYTQHTYRRSNIFCDHTQQHHDWWVKQEPAGARMVVWSEALLFSQFAAVTICLNVIFLRRLCMCTWRSSKALVVESNLCVRTHTHMHICSIAQTIEFVFFIKHLN